MYWLRLFTSIRNEFRGLLNIGVKSRAMNGDDEGVIQGVQESAEELIIRIAKKADGIGSAGAGAIASDFSGDLQAFLTADAERFGKIKSSSGRSVLKPAQIEAITREASLIPKGLPLQETWVFYLGREFLRSQVAMVSQLSLDSFDINPLLAKALNFDTPKKVIAFNVYQTVTRSVVTSWGDVVEEIAKFSGCRDNDEVIEGKTGTNFDLIKELDGIDYYIQVKSGPNTMNVGMVTSLNEAIKHIEGKKSTARGILGMTYGTRSRISAQILGNLADAETRMKVGREFWDFISEKKDFHKDLFRLLELSSSDILKDSFIELIEAKVSELEASWKTKYPGATLNDLLEGYL